MATYSATNNGLNLDNLWSYADRRIRKELLSSWYQRSPIITFMTGKLKGESNLGRPGSLGVIGGSGNFSSPERTNEAGAEVQVRLQSANSKSVKYMGATDTSPSMGNQAQNRDRTSAYFRWTGPLASAVKVDNQVIRTSNGAKIASATEEAVDQATENLLDQLKLDIWRGNPTSQTADVWDNPLGILQAIDTDNTYGNITRSSATHYWSGNRVTTALTPSLKLIDDANLGVRTCSGIGFPMKNYGMGANLWLASNAVYAKLKDEALARGQSITVGDMPEASKVGIKYECIMYGNATIVADPTLTGTWTSYDSDVTDATKVMVGLTTEDWIFSINPTENFRLTKFVDQGEATPGGDDALTASFRLMYRQYCRKPHRQIVFTNLA